MAIEINTSHIMPPNAEPVGRQEKAAAAGREQKDETSSGGILDEYTKSEPSDAKPSGLYRFEQDEHGNKKLVFDDPKKDTKTCTGNTDQVDREIRKLKEKAQQLEQQIQAASGDEKKVSDLEKKLAQVKSELSQKDNDTYRRQHTIFS